MSELPKGLSVSVQSTLVRRADSMIRKYAYVIHETGWQPYVSHYRFHSEHAAQLAGERDAHIYFAREKGGSA